MKANGTEIELMTNTTLLIDLIAKNILAGRVCLFNIDNSFKYEFGQSSGEIHEVSSISSEVSIDITPNKVANVDFPSHLIKDTKREGEGNVDKKKKVKKL